MAAGSGALGRVAGGDGAAGRLRSWLGPLGAWWPVAGGDEESLAFAGRDELSRDYADRHGDDTDPETPSPEDLNNTTGNGRPRITTWQAAWNVTNAIQGIFVMGLPYAVLQSGVVGLFLLPLAALICSYTGGILIACLYEDDGQGRAVRLRHTYEDVARACCRGGSARLAVPLLNAAQLIELCMTCVLYLVVSSNLLVHSFPFLPLTPGVASLVTFVTLLPCVLIFDLRVVSRLSCLCSLAQFFITLLILGYCVRRSPGWSWSWLAPLSDPEKLQVAVGAIIFSYTSQIFLPALEGSMESPQDFGRMLGWTHALACLLKTLLSLGSLFTWGGATKEVVSDNLPGGLRALANLCLLAKALLSYPLPFYAAAELLGRSLSGRSMPGRSLSGRGEGSGEEGRVAGQGESQDTVGGQTTGQSEEREEGRGEGRGRAEGHGRCEGRGRGEGRGSALALRACLLLLTLLTALCVPRLSLLMGLTGSVTGAAMTLLLPALFHLQLKWAQLGRGQRALDMLTLTLGALCSLAGLVCTVQGVLEVLRGS